MTLNRRTTASLLSAALLLSLPLAASDRPHIISQPRDCAIAIDGGFDDWSGALEPLGTQPLSVQAVNDGDFLYLRVTASDAAARMQIVRQGLTVWFDPSGGTKKKLGIKYPVVEHGALEENRGGSGGRTHGRGREGDGGREDSDYTPSDRVDVIGPGKDDARSLTREHLSGLDVALRVEQGLLQYELKVPLARSSDHPYAIDAEPGKTIGLGFETGKMQQRGFGEGRGGGYGGGGGGIGGRGGMPGHGGGGMRGGGEGRGGQPPKPIKAWATLAIARAR
jgi:hypothetical protein